MKKEKKPDLSMRDPVGEASQRQLEREKKLYPLRINKNTVLLVKKSKCNEKYRMEVEERLRKYKLWGYYE